MRFRWHHAGIAALALGLASGAEARVELVEWQHSVPSQVSGFKLHVGSRSGSYGAVIDVGLSNSVDGRFSHPLTVGDNDTVYVAVSAYNPAGSSPLSNERALAPAPAQLPPPPPPGEGGTPQVEDTETFTGFEKKWSMVGAMDMWGNGKSDLVWRDGNSIGHQLWLMDGGSVMAGVPFEVPSKRWQLVGSGDVDGEGSDDLIWWDKKQKRIFIWLYWANPVGAIELTQGATQQKWEPVDVGDVDGDGHADLVWYAKKEKAYYAWRLDAKGILDVLEFDPPEENQALAGLGDFDGNGTADLLWENKKTGYHVWLMNGAQTLDEGALGPPEKGWKLAGIGDLDGDGRDDLLWDHKKAALHVWVMDGDRVREEAFLMEVEKGWGIAGVGDFDADGIEDVLLQHKKDLRARIAYIGVAR